MPHLIRMQHIHRYYFALHEHWYRQDSQCRMELRDGEKMWNKSDHEIYNDSKSLLCAHFSFIYYFSVKFSDFSLSNCGIFWSKYSQNTICKSFWENKGNPHWYWEQVIQKSTHYFNFYLFWKLVWHLLQIYLRLQWWKTFWNYTKRGKESFKI